MCIRDRDHARRLIGKAVEITVTSVLQTASGKMIFGKVDVYKRQVVQKCIQEGEIVQFQDSWLPSSHSTVIWRAGLVFSNIGTSGKNLRP